MHIWKIGALVSALPPLAFAFYLVVKAPSFGLESYQELQITPLLALLFLFPLSIVTFPYFWWKMLQAFWKRRLPRQGDMIGMLVCMICMLAVLRLGVTVGIDVWGQN